MGFSAKDGDPFHADMFYAFLEAVSSPSVTGVPVDKWSPLFMAELLFWLDRLIKTGKILAYNYEAVDHIIDQHYYFILGYADMDQCDNELVKSIAKNVN